jgi:hypothetical protein
MASRTSIYMVSIMLDKGNSAGVITRAFKDQSILNDIKLGHDYSREGKPQGT